MNSGWTAHVMPSIAYSDHSFSDIININSMRVKGWTNVNFTAGVSDDTLSAEFFVTNLTNEKITQGANYVNDRERLALAPPTTFGIRMSYDF